MNKLNKPEDFFEHIDWVQQLAHSLVFDPARADDVVQQTWLEVLKKPPENVQNPKGWLYRVVRNIAYKSKRKERMEVAKAEKAMKEELLPSTVDLVSQASSMQKMVGVVLELKEPYRTAILLHYFENLSPQEIAVRQSVPVDSVYTRLRRALTMLRAKLDSTYGDRSTWCQVFLPLALLAKPEKAISFPKPIKAVRGLYISSAAAVLLFFGFGGFWWANRGSENPSSGTNIASSSSTSSASTTTGSNAPIADTTDSARGKASQVSATASTSAENSGSSNSETKPTTPETPPLVSANEGYLVKAKAVDMYGTPIADLEVELKLMDDKKEFNSRGILKTDAEGKVAWKFDSEPEMARLRFSQKNPKKYFLCSLKFPNDVDSDHVLLISNKAKLSGLVRNSQMRVLQGTRVNVQVPTECLKTLPPRYYERAVASFSQDSGIVARDITDNDGRFEFPALPLIKGAAVSFSLWGYMGQRFLLNEDPVQTVEVTLEREIDIDEGYQEVHGEVVDEEGKPLDDADIVFGPAWAYSNNLGEFYFELDQGTMPAKDEPLVVKKQGFVPSIVPNLAERLAQPALKDKKVSVVLSKNEKFTEGVLLDAEGQPVPDFYINVFDPTFYSSDARSLEGQPTSNHIAWPKSDENGRFRFGSLWRKQYRFFLMREQLSFITEPIDVQSGKIEIRLPKKLSFEPVKGKLLTSDGKPVTSAGIRLQTFYFDPQIRKRAGYRDVMQWETTVKTDDQGAFEISDLPRYGGSLVFNAKGIVETVFDLPANADEKELLVIAKNPCYLHVEEPVEALTANYFKILDADGNLEIVGFRKEVSSPLVERYRSYGLLPLYKLKAYLGEVGETAKTLVLTRGYKEVRRIPLQMKPGEVFTISQ